MESAALSIISSGNPLAIVALICVVAMWFVIKHQRKTTAETRDSQNEALTTELKNTRELLAECTVKVAELQEKQQELIIKEALMTKDVDYLKEENATVKQDLKDIKTTLSTMALSLERIAARYDARED